MFARTRTRTSACRPSPTCSKAQWFTARVLIGELLWVTSPVKPTTPTLYSEFSLLPGSTLHLPAGEFVRAIYGLEGTVNIDGEPLDPFALGVLNGAASVITAPSGAQFVIIGGPPRGHRHMVWNFVSSRSERIAEAKVAWRAQAMGRARPNSFRTERRAGLSYTGWAPLRVLQFRSWPTAASRALSRHRGDRAQRRREAPDIRAERSTSAPGAGVAVGLLEQRASRQAEAACRELLARIVRTPLASKVESPPSGAGCRPTCGAFCRLPSF